MRNFLNETRSERQFRSLTGLSRKQFDQLLDKFVSCLEIMKNEEYKNNRKNRKRRPGGGRKGLLETPEKKLFFILYYLKNYPTFDVLGFVFGMSTSKAAENVHALLPVLERAERDLKILPKRVFKKAMEFSEVFDDNQNIMIDATEREHFRPGNKKQQKAYYSGKKKRHTVKNTVISDQDKRLVFVGRTSPGSMHDYALFKKEFNPKEDWFHTVKGWLDLGYQGIKTDYQSPENIRIPHKKPRKSKKNPHPSLTSEQKEENRRIGRKRVPVEHAIGGMKIFHILTIKIRNKLKKFTDKVIYVVAGLWNLKNSHAFQ